MMSEMSIRREHSAWLPAVGTVLSIISCYGTLGLVTMGIIVAPSVHVWAAAIVVFALVAGLIAREMLPRNLPRGG